jgi:hypothetical protein
MKTYKTYSLIILGLVFSYSLLAQGKDKLITDWLFVYYMPYDNNLSHLSDTILSMLKNNIKSNDAIVTVQADLRDMKGIKRYLYSSDTSYVDKIPDEYSAHTKTYKNYLNWAVSNVSYNHIAVILLDHGGKLDELCLDERPQYKFLKVDSVATAIKEVIGDNKIDLLYLQVCTKASIEPLFEFRDIAKYTLSSQKKMGAPNYYYKNLFNSFSSAKLANGYEIAELIAKNEREDMYSSLTLIDNSKLDSLLIMFKEFSSQLEKLNDIQLKAYPLDFIYYGDYYWDLISTLESIDLRDHKEIDKLRQLIINYLQNELIVFHKKNPVKNSMADYCGISMVKNWNIDEIKYHKLEFYSVLKAIRALKLK